MLACPLLAMPESDIKQNRLDWIHNRIISLTATHAKTVLRQEICRKRFLVQKRYKKAHDCVCYAESQIILLESQYTHHRWEWSVCTSGLYCMILHEASKLFSRVCLGSLAELNLWIMFENQLFSVRLDEMYDFTCHGAQIEGRNRQEARSLICLSAW